MHVLTLLFAFAKLDSYKIIDFFSDFSTIILTHAIMKTKLHSRENLYQQNNDENKVLVLYTRAVAFV
jgi:hypothetical protein